MSSFDREMADIVEERNQKEAQWQTEHFRAQADKPRLVTNPKLRNGDAKLQKLDSKGGLERGKMRSQMGKHQ